MEESRIALALLGSVDAVDRRSKVEGRIRKNIVALTWREG